MENLTELELINLAKEKDGDALVTLFEKNIPMVRNVIRKFYVRHYDINDWLQDALYVCYESACLFKPELNVRFSGFFQLRLINHARGLVRHELAKKRAPYSKAKSYEDEIETNMVTESSSNIELTNQAVNISDLQNSITDFSMMELLALHFYLGNLSEEQCLEKLNCNKLQFMAAKYRCKRKMKQFL